MLRRLFHRLWERFSLYLKLPALFMAALLVSTIYFAWHSHLMTTVLILDSIDQRLILCVELIDSYMPKDFPDRAVSADAIPLREDEVRRVRLARLAEMAGLDHMYILTRVNGVIYAIASNNLEYFSPYHNEWGVLRETEIDGETRFDNNADSRGALRSIIVRRVSPGGRVYFIGADLPLREIDELERRLLRNFRVTGVAYFFLFGLGIFIVVRMITRPLKRLSDFIDQTCRNGFEHGPALDIDLLPLSPNAADEVRLLTKNFQSMQMELADYLSRLAETISAKERAESDMRIAGDIQQSLLVSTLPEAPAFSVWGAMIPAKLAGGDFYDYFRLDGRRLCFAVGDVSGKGVSAAMLMATSLTLLRAYLSEAAGEADSGALAANMLLRMDETLARQNESMQFVTAILGVLDEENGLTVLANGGHNSPLIIRGGVRAEYLTLPPGGVLGAGLCKEFTATRLTLAPGDTLFLYTDGVTEAMAADDSFFGEERLLAVVTEAASKSPRVLAGTVMDAVRAFSIGRELADDVTVLAVRWHGREKLL